VASSKPLTAPIFSSGIAARGHPWLAALTASIICRCAVVMPRSTMRKDTGNDSVSVNSVPRCSPTAWASASSRTPASMRSCS
jgi:hypothetical protein